MLNNKLQKKNSEKGNALFLILIAVALFAALSYAITQSGRGGGSIDRETAMIAASQITQYPSSLRTAITRMVITGVAVSQVDFTNPSTGLETEVFDYSGGGATVQTPPSSSGATAWGYKDVKDATNGYYIWDVGSNTNIIGRDIVAYLPSVSIAVCQQINKGLGISGDIPVQTVAVNYVGTGATVPVSVTEGTGAANVFGAKFGEAFLCFKNATTYDYYHALVEQ